MIALLNGGYVQVDDRLHVGLEIATHLVPKHEPAGGQWARNIYSCATSPRVRIRWPSWRGHVPVPISARVFVNRVQLPLLDRGKQQTTGTHPCPHKKMCGAAVPRLFCFALPSGAVGVSPCSQHARAQRGCSSEEGFEFERQLQPFRVCALAPLFGLGVVVFRDAPFVFWLLLFCPIKSCTASLSFSCASRARMQSSTIPSHPPLSHEGRKQASHTGTHRFPPSHTATHDAPSHVLLHDSPPSGPHETSTTMTKGRVSRCRPSSRRRPPLGFIVPPVLDIHASLCLHVDCHEAKCKSPACRTAFGPVPHIC